MTLLLGLVLSGIPCWFDPQATSIFRELDKRQNVSQVLAVPSNENERYGMAIQSHGNIPKLAYEMAREHLSHSTVRLVVQQDYPLHFIGWTPQGVPVDLTKIELPDQLRTELKAGELAMLVEEPLYKGRNYSLNLRASSIWGKDFDDFRTTWLKIGPKQGTHMNVRLEVHLSEYLGTIDTNVGSKFRDRNTSFRVESLHAEPVTGANANSDVQWVDIAESNMSSPVQYQFLFLIDLPKILKEVGRNFIFGIGGSGGGYYRKEDEVLVHRIASPAPVKYWKSVSVSRVTPMAGYLSHIATEPIEQNSN